MPTFIEAATAAATFLVTSGIVELRIRVKWGNTELTLDTAPVRPLMQVTRSAPTVA